MNSQPVLERIRGFVLSRFPLARQHGVRDDDSLLEGGIVDSMGVLELVTFLEAEFDIVLSDDEVVSETFESINALARLIESRQASSIASAEG